MHRGGRSRLPEPKDPAERSTAQEVQALPIALGYVACSSMMMIINKWALREFPFAGSLMALQFVSSAAVVRLLASAGQLECEPLQWERARSFMLVPIVFAIAIFANIKLLQAASVESVIVFRTLVPIITSWADYAFMGRELPSAQSGSGLLIVVLGALLYSRTSGEGFRVDTWLWVVVYLLTLSFEMVYVKHVLSSQPMGTWTRVYYNNALALMCLPPFLILGSEYAKLGSAASLLFSSPSALLSVVLSCLVGLGISFTGFRFRALVSATTFTVVGVMNKILTIFASITLLSNASGATSPAAVVALIVCIGGGTMYRQSPMRTLGPSLVAGASHEEKASLIGSSSGDNGADSHAGIGRLGPIDDRSATSIDRGRLPPA